MIKDKKRPLLTALGFAIFAAVFIVVTLLLCAVFGRFEDDNAEKVGADALPVIVIDPGHGGRDGGAIGGNGAVVEKDLNLDIAKTLASLLRIAGYEVVMTRSDDIMLVDPAVTSSKKASDLSARLKIAERYENAIFISIHMNAFPDPKYGGLQVYYSKNHEGSLTLARDIQESSRRLDPSNGRKVKAAGENIYLLHKLSCPALLIECGFLSNEAECARLAEDEYRDQLALLFFERISDYICKNY
ncbi:MAG: N-acetylmuramoyl-L-alanine amidase [Clostridia bacterium]|nr:N-acetylmuramoyl-L-alanine amidase [Clostridia bacterium]